MKVESTRFNSYLTLFKSFQTHQSAVWNDQT